MAQVLAQRTPEELGNPEYNYFIAFKIDPKETDKSKIETRIKTALSSTSGTIVGRRLNELRNDVLEVMCNDSVFNSTSGTYAAGKGGRAKEAAAAKTFKLKEAIDIVEILCQTRKMLLKSELIDILNVANKPVTYITESEFFGALSYLEKMGVKIIDNTDVSIPFSEYKKAENLLNTPNKKDLYDFLGLPPSASAAEIQKAMMEQSHKANMVRISDKSTAQSIDNLCPIVKKLLLSGQAARDSYDRYLILRDEVWADFEKRKSFSIKEMSMEEYADYTQKVIELLKVSVAEAEKILAVGFKFFQFNIVGKSDGSNFEVCPYPDCGKLYVKGAKSCPHCGKPLEIFCWNCRQTMRFTKDDKGCSACGATVHAHELFRQKCSALDGLLAKPVTDIATLQTAFLAIKNVVPNFASCADSVVAKKVNEYEGVIAARIKREETTGAKYREEVVAINELVAQKRYQSALALARGLAVKYPGYDPENTRKLTDSYTAVMNSAQQQVELAKQYMAQRNEGMAVAAAVKAIKLCDDHTEARQILQKFPPKPVTGLRASLDGGKIRLEWGAVKQDYVTYTVIKKVGVAPTSAEDGALVEDGLSICFYEDLNIVSATPYFYAVYAERYGVRSSITATQTVVMGYADVANVRQEVVAGGVKVTWDTPQNVKSVEVWKNSGAVAPMNPGEGKRVPVSENGFTDAGCDSESAYLIVCNYDVKGKIVYSHGVRAVFKPFEKTEPLRGVRIEPLGGGRYIFSCDAGYTGKVRLYTAATKLSIPTDTTLRYLDFNSICKGLTSVAAVPNSEGRLVFSLPVGKIYQVYAIVSTEQLFIVSPPVLINMIEGIVRCTHTFADGIVTVMGQLHPKASAVIIRIGQKDYIDTPETGGEKFTFRTEEFSRKGKLELKLKTDTVNYITVFVEFREDGVTSYAQPVRLTPPIDYRETIPVLYSMEYVPNPSKPFKVMLSFEADKEVFLPNMVLMQGGPRPLNKNAGGLCERVDDVVLKKGLFSKKYTAKRVIMAKPVPANVKFALFLDEDVSFIQLKEVRKL